ncbi:alpha/beta hydrolase [Nocardia aobensis]|uniref:Alpha/beta hydrolase n=1 Tax=Nocardia aobensis TaxID=257277 RepID=A0ABW6P9R7_9NOCA
MVGRTRRISLSYGAGRLSGLLSTAPTPRALVVALHGGGLHSGYFHGAADPDLSLLDIGYQLGYSVLALDRPGYGESAGTEHNDSTLEGQAATIWRALDDLPEADGAEVGLVGHSFGSMVALQMAADRPSDRTLIGVDFSGIGTKYADAVFTNMSGPVDRSMHWGRETFYPATTFDKGVRPVAPIPLKEQEEALAWPDRAHAVTKQVECPVRITHAEFEPNWDDELPSLAALFVNSPWVSYDVQMYSGHNISLSWSARAYHLRSFAFFDDCLNGLRQQHTQPKG